VDPWKEYRVRTRGYADLDQLGWELLDKTGLVLADPTGCFPINGGMTAASTAEGSDVVLMVYTDIPEGGLSADHYEVRSLCGDDLKRVLSVTENHIALPAPVWRGACPGVVRRYSGSVGRVLVTDRRTGDEAFASGFLFTTQRTLLTAAHVVDPTRFAVRHVEFGKETVAGELRSIDNKLDVALLRLERPMSGFIVHWCGGASQEDLGAHCIVIGHPNVPGLEPSPSIYELQLVSLKKSYLMGATMLELSTHLGGGFSGSPVFDARQRLLGMVVSYPDDDRGDERGISWPRWTPLALNADHLEAWRHEAMTVAD
jgi:hypothetical protein